MPASLSLCACPTPHSRLRAEDYDREKELAEREEKKKLFTVLTQDNNIGTSETRKIFDRYRALPIRMIQNGTDFDLFCSVLGILPTGQYHKLFNLYDREGTGYVDMKAFLLGLFNFVNLEKEEKVQFIFALFDEDRSGFLSEEEILEILKATHIQTADAVRPKLATLMKQVLHLSCLASRGTPSLVRANANAASGLVFLTVCVVTRSAREIRRSDRRAHV